MQYIGAGFSPRANIILVRLSLHHSLHSQWRVLLHLLLHRLPLLGPGWASERPVRRARIYQQTQAASIIYID
jgi:hypothetical protein